MPKSKQHICHLTILNPALHSRIFYKEALSQVNAGYKVTIIGQDPASEPYEKKGIKVIPIGVFGRGTAKRWRARRKVHKLARKVKADIFQVHTPELLKVCKELKEELPHTKIIYDVHEDYAANIVNTNTYPSWTKKTLARWVKDAESKFKKYGDAIFYSEDCYAGLVDFPKKKTAFVRNKFSPPKRIGPPDHEFKLPYMLYCGTISHMWGIKRTLELWKALNKLEPLDLVIAGHTFNKELIEELEKQADKHNKKGKIHILGGLEYLPHRSIIELIKGSMFGTAFYKAVPYLKDKIPTKFYEFMGLGTPLLFTDNPPWNSLNDQFDFGMPVSFPLDKHAVRKIYDALLLEKRDFYRKPLSESDWSWKAEETQMLNLIAKVLAE